jgi:GGDEF domain-containing protein
MSDHFVDSPHGLRPEHLAPLLHLLSPREIMMTHRSGVEDRYEVAATKIITRVKEGVTPLKRSIDELRQAADIRSNELPKLDDLTGAYSRTDLYTLLSICKELGHNRVRLTFTDLEHLKDYNKRLGEPSGGDFALVTFTMAFEPIVIQHNGILVRNQGAGGDDFIFIDFPQDGEDDDSIASELNSMLSVISVDTFRTGMYGDRVVENYTSHKPIVVDSSKLDSVERSTPDLVPILFPPKFSAVAIIIDPTSDVSIQTHPSGDEFYNFDKVATKIEKALEQIKQIKDRKLTGLIQSNPNGATHLSRRGGFQT